MVHKIKVCLMGDSGVGKTSLITRFLSGEPPTEVKTTVGVDIFNTEVFDFPDTKVKYVIWDLAGQPRFEQVRKEFYRGTQAAMVVYDVTDPESFNNISKWLRELRKHNGNKYVPLVVVGNKIDLLSDSQPMEVVQKESVEELLADLRETYSKMGLDVPWIETSAMTGEKVDEAFMYIGTEFINYLRRMRNEAESRRRTRRTIG